MSQAFDPKQFPLPQDYSLRLMRPGDHEAVAGLMGLYFKELGLTLEHDGLDSDLSDPESGYGEGGFLLLTHQDEAVGCVGLRAWGDGAGEIKRMYLQPGHRSRGLGERLIKAVIALARSKGFSRLLLDTRKDLKAANRLYQRQGFVDTMNYNLNPRASRFMVLELD